RPYFADVEDGAAGLSYSVSSASNPALFTATTVNATTDELRLDYAPGAFGTSTVTVRATDTGGLFVDSTFTVTISPDLGPRNARVGPEFRVNTYTAGYQGGHTMAALDGGGYVVAWTSQGQDGFSGFGVYARRYHADGSPAGGEFRLSTTAGEQWDPNVAALPG